MLSAERSIIGLAVGWSHLVFVNAAGIAYGLGDDKNHAIGTDSRAYHSTPKSISFDQELVTCVACTQCETMYLTFNGKLIICSEKNEGGRLAVNIPTSVVFIGASYSSFLAIDVTGNLYLLFFDPQEPPVRHQLHKPIYDAARGEGFAIAVALDGACFGNGLLNEGLDDFGRIPSLRGEKVLRVYAYFNHAAVITTDFRALTWGSNSKGQLGRDDKVPASEFSEVLGLDGHSIVAAALGYESSLFLTSKGILFGCGWNKYGQLFIPPSKKVLMPARAALAPDAVSAVFAGDKFAVVLVGVPAPAHPGMGVFGIQMASKPDPRKAAPVRRGATRVSTSARTALY
jgi:alpha-tubulin suppressor-like RCC1 family protein